MKKSKITVWNSKSNEWLPIDNLKSEQQKSIKQRIGKVIADACEKQINILNNKNTFKKHHY